MKPVVLMCAMLCGTLLFGQYTLVDTNLPDLSASYISWADLDVKEGHRGYLSIYNLKGQKVFSQLYCEGSHQVAWQGMDLKNQHCAPGVYIYRFSSESFNQSGKMLFLGD